MIDTIYVQDTGKTQYTQISN